MPPVTPTGAAGAHALAGTLAAWMWLLPVLPLLGFVVNGLLSVVPAARVGPADPDMGHGDAHDGIPAHAPTDEHHPHTETRPPFGGLVSLVGPGVVVLAFLLAVGIWNALRTSGATTPFVQHYWSWMPAGSLQVNASFQLDQLSMLMVLIITGVGALIHLFSVGYMRQDPAYARYFAYLNLFVFFMLVLVLGASYPVLFVGWEGVGLASYLLIGFWFTDKANADAGKKAFIVNRIGDFGFLVAMFLIFANVGTLSFTGVAAAAGTGALAFGTPLVTTICLFLFLGCAGKSAQIPLYVWLPDAMAGPTPVSALIHAATMVTAGVYLVARSSFLFSLSPVASMTVAVVGAVTALFAATIGLKQWDIKKVLAYSTISQLGYMFVGVGVGAYAAGVFHLTTHAFFKALLFLGSGSVIHAMHGAYHETGSHADAQDMRNMGGLRRYLPWTWALMWIATLAISGIPPFAGFFSKDEILGSVFERAGASTFTSASWLGIPGRDVLYAVYAIGLAAAFLTAVYMTRMMLYTFHGPNRTGERERGGLHEAPWIMTGPLVVLGVLSVIGGWLNLPSLTSFLGPVGTLDHWLQPVVGAATLRVTNGVALEPTHSAEVALVGAAVAIAIAGIALAALVLKPAALVPKAEALPEHGFEKVLANKYYVDEAYDAAIVEPTVAVSRNVFWRGLDAGVIDGLFVNGSGYLARGVGWLGARLQTGNAGGYAWLLVIGALAVIGAFSFR